MSDLRRRLAGGLPGLPPRGKLPNKGPGRGGRTRTYTPLPWARYWDEKKFVETERGRFCVYTRGIENAGAAVVMIHGGGYSALTWSLATHELVQLTDCRLVALDLRGHGETTVNGDETDLSGSTMIEDIRDVITALFPSESKGLVLVGHSMGGALAALLAESSLPALAGLIVVDVVEGTALDALASMQGVLRSRPTKFASVEQAIEWCVRSGQVRNHESARISMPGQIVNNNGILAASLVEENEGQEDAAKNNLGKLSHSVNSSDCIQEEDDVGSVSGSGEMTGPNTTVPPSNHFSWRVDLSKSEPYWTGWFSGLSNRFLNAPAAKLLLLAGVDRLDKDLTVGQMQGKFQMHVLPAVGHTVHEDSPDKVAEVIAAFLVRNKLATATDAFQSAGPFRVADVPGCMGPPPPPPF